jgi:undecaprenyl-diphosphatase
MEIITLLKYLLLGLVQGIAEILPISSSGHLALLQYLLEINADQEATFAIFLHLASLVALVIFFWKTIIRVIGGFFLFIFKKDATRKDDFWLAVYIVVASIPAGVIGVLFSDTIEGFFGELLYVGIGFLVTAVILFLWPVLGSNRDEKYRWKHIVAAGLFQVVGILPGVSRSGMTITGAKIGGLKEPQAKEFAFLLFLPVALGSFAVSLGDVGAIFNADSVSLIYYLSAMVAAGIFTYLALVFIFKRFHYGQAKYFAIYLVAVGILTLILGVI